MSIDHYAFIHFNDDESLAKAQLLILKQTFAIFTLMGINHLWKVPVPLSQISISIKILTYHIYTMLESKQWRGKQDERTSNEQHSQFTRTYLLLLLFGKAFKPPAATFVTSSYKDVTVKRKRLVNSNRNERKGRMTSLLLPAIIDWPI